MFRTSDQVISLVEETVETSQKPLLFMNVPFWFSFHSRADQEYPIGHLGVQGIPAYVGLDGLYYALTGQTVVIESAALAPDVSGWTYAWGQHGAFVDHAWIDERLRAGRRLAIMTLNDSGPEVHVPGGFNPDGGNPAQALATFAVRVDLQRRAGPLKTGD